MMIRLFNFVVVAALVVAAVMVYEVKYQSTYKAQAVVRLSSEIRAEREKIATLNAEWSRLATPERIQTLAERYLGLRPQAVTQIDDFATLPQKAAPLGDPLGDLIESLPVDGQRRDAIGSMIETLDASNNPPVTGSATPRR